MWRRRFAADASIVGQAVTLSAKPYIVVGVAPALVTTVIGESDVWVPMAFDEKEAALYGSHYLRAWGRLRPSATLQEAEADLDRIEVRLVLRQAIVLALSGVAIGTLSALGVTRLMQSLLFNTSTTDVVTFTAVPLVLMAVVALASIVPAFRATRIDPQITLRGE